MKCLTEIAFNKLKKYCEAQNYKGWDPYDGLNSKLFQALPFKKWDVARLLWIQFFKRSPVNFRTLTGVPKAYNAKGIALFLSGYCNLYNVSKFKNTSYGSSKELKGYIIKLADLLLTLQNKDHSGACWGYNFDWQARRLFLFPKNTPTVVATSFAVDALLKAYTVTKKQTYLNACISASKFVLNDLNRTEYKSGFLFSYSPLNGNNTVFNASLLGAKILSQVYMYTKDDILKTTAKRTIKACCEAQNKNGSWIYGMLPIQSWIDSFHTGYNLDAIQTYQDCTGDITFQANIAKGLSFYLEHFFKSNGTPKYYHNKTYPIDIHCPGQLFVTLSKLNVFPLHNILAQQVMQWTIKHMQDKRGFFYYQIKKGINSKISYMRWSNAFMFNAMSYYLLEKEIQKHKI
ncbi:delta-aminolevulinic acid dehydratase [Flavivirga aquimarina]|uniref:Delta-aminolevulinic acid dehydratase n=1 Tax=Flavivirga aquimarina TaxID=2027862 RepID=A0ABT8W736_9FLAO|nr:delta-aminolevulinic acid dehydratase [Flavivirga aquimarina]MDO5968910.1 delta-aminolevulinic acid dehydratase [Flavivirga aquimarina]